ncbi:serine--tRNA ligase [Candidatus Nanogingivalis gingivitcus]|jgi:serine--tRNA ligase|uniref:Serine--tRNA ligase n=1 Tax=Candidatus Nanogingivalis gingivitcus TaxID=2171992 RepID=A0ABY0FK00_9BACT|nr:serine--tRNA ligase [Candidatus Nanogingivalis gingivitcus]RYC72419.1 Serine--tRNA ligase [Candidatus Nanogingivalis gingivitcus]
MLDIKFIRENTERVKQNTLDKGYKNVDIDRVIELDQERKALGQEIDSLRSRRNEIANSMKIAKSKPSSELIAEGKELKEKISALEDKYRHIDQDFMTILKSIPNILQDDVPIGEEGEDEVVKEWGKDITEKRFGSSMIGAEDHLDFANRKDWVDFERGTKVAGTKFYFLKGELALLENAIYQFALNKLLAKGFKFMTVPHMVNGNVATGTGFAPRASEQSDEYFIENQDLSLIATAEMSLTGYHADEILNEDDLPLFYAGYSPCYRKEAGTYGKHTRGLFRVHQFNKLEMYAFTLPEQSKDAHERILAVEEEIYQELGIPYRIINIASGDLGAPASKKYDIEYWSPVDGKYREITSCSNCTDYQARNLNIRVRRKNGDIEVLHTLNGTAVSLARCLVAFIENFQDGDDLLVPEVLKPYMGGKTRI